MRIPFTLAVVCLTLTGCVSMDAAECRSADWFRLGFRDGLAGLRRMDIGYEDQCAKHGVRLDTAAYGTGWQDGHWEYSQRAIRDSTD